MSRRTRQKYVAVNADEILGLLTGKYVMELPDDAEIVYVRSGVMFNMVEFLVRSEQYAELETGSMIPTETQCLIRTKEEGAAK